MKTRLLIILLYFLVVRFHHTEAQEIVPVEDFTTFVTYEWKPVKLFLNDLHIPLSTLGEFRPTFKKNGEYLLIREKEVVKGTWKYLPEAKVFITNDKDGIQKHKVLFARDEKMITETLIPNGTLRVEYKRVK